MEIQRDGMNQNLRKGRIRQWVNMERGREIINRILQEKYQKMVDRLIIKTGREPVLTRDESKKVI